MNHILTDFNKINAGTEMESKGKTYIFWDDKSQYNCVGGEHTGRVIIILGTVCK
jgi:hypothetical protein